MNRKRASNGIEAVIVALVAVGLGAGSARASDVEGVPAAEFGVRDVMVVPNAEAATVSLIDARSFRVLRTIDTAPDGTDAEPGSDDPAHALIGQRIVEAAGGPNYAQDVDVSPGGRTLYVSRGHRGDVAAFNLRTGRMRWKLRIPGFRSDHMTISRDGRRLYVSALTEDEVEVVDVRTGTIVDSFPTGQWPHDNHLSEDGRRLYNGSIGNIIVEPEAREASPIPPYQLTIVDPATLAPLARHTFDRGIRPFEVTRDERRIYAQLSDYHGVVEIGLPDGRITRRRALPVDAGVTEDDYDFEAPHHGLALSHDERTLCLAGRASDYVALVATKTMKPTAIVEVDDAPGWAAVTPRGRHCFVANTRADTVSVISFAARREVRRIRAGNAPKLIQPARLPVAVVCTTRAVQGCTPKLSVKTSCRAGGGLRVRVNGETDAVTSVAFRVGERLIARDEGAPWRRTFGRATQRRFDGEEVRVIAAVTRGRATHVERTATMRRCG